MHWECTNVHLLQYHAEGEQLVWGWAFCPAQGQKGVCAFVATDNPHVDPSGGPSPELTPGDGSPDGGSIDVTAVPGVQAASSNLGGVVRGFEEDQLASLRRAS
ncbi:hypothetical protein Hamer_G011478 [Homarus americanus]|uniref:Uncharacterized protein n=1 Tax=Homarus americanus TaxID=6706 RepID=A0A8J5JNH3_HOMAM|nr:hypothetical protein Hamer_G011478 [Homarus americanus]